VVCSAGAPKAAKDEMPAAAKELASKILGACQSAEGTSPESQLIAQLYSLKTNTSSRSGFPTAMYGVFSVFLQCGGIKALGVTDTPEVASRSPATASGGR
jgi:hypothetical protein